MYTVFYNEQICKAKMKIKQKKQNKHENKTQTRCPRFDNNNLTTTRFGGEL